jgi:heme/copper-type cytochrome/quinol oxidase subunit 3
MSRRTWWYILTGYEAVWLLYMIILLPVAVSLFSRVPSAQLRSQLGRLTTTIPLVLLVSAVAWSLAIYDILKRQSVRLKLLWVISFVLLGAIALPVYYAAYVHQPSRPNSAGDRAG